MSFIITVIARVAVVIALISLVTCQSSCSVSTRTDCGFVGINQSQCQQKGCCWVPVNPNPNNLPWCFYANSSVPSNPQCNNQGDRADCGYSGITEQQCTAMNCCWNAVNPNPGNLPWCFYTNPTLYGYSASNVNYMPWGLEATLTILPGNSSTTYGSDISPLKLIVMLETTERLHVKIYDASSSRYEVPYSVLPRSSSPPTSPPSNPNYLFSYTASPFGFAVTRKSDGMVLFNSSLTNPPMFNGLTFKDQYLSLSTQLPSNASIYGLAESTNSDGFRLMTNGHVYTFWNRDTPSATANQNLYGTHPFYLQMLSNGNAHGVLLLNSDGMDVVINSNSLTYKAIGGILDFYFFMGPSPDAVVAQYTQFIGTPHMPAYWALGFHQSRYGYPNIQTVQQVVANYSAANIPLDTIWNDIDYMDQYRDFTYDPVNYPVSTVSSFVQQLHNQGQQYVVIIDPGIEIYNGYSSYSNLLSSGAYIYDAQGKPFVGNVWPGDTIFPDFLHPNAQSYWQNEIANFLKLVDVDGLWIDMNEISNFCTGECSSKKRRHQSRASGFNPSNPPYAINNGGSRQPLNIKTLDMTAVHYNNTLEYDVHNLYGLTESIATKIALENIRPNVRSFVLTRSTFVGSGHHVAHWTGDNASDWNNLYWSILGMLNFNILGVPFVGSDICGFLDNTTEELCSRWIELGAFYPFSRNHNDIHSVSQELYLWPSVAAISRQVLGMRYALLPYYYTLFYHANQNGTAVIRPLFFQFPTDSNCLSIDRQFLVGDALMISPVLKQGATTVNVYFPKAVWYDYYTGLQASYSGNVVLNAPVNYIPVHMRGGSIVVTQTPDLTTAKTRLNPFTIVVALDANYQARGTLFWDDGKSINSIANKSFTYLKLSASKGQLQVAVNFGGTSGPNMDNVNVWGVPTAPSSVSVNSSPLSSSQWSYSSSSKILSVTSLGIALTKSFTLKWQ